MRKNWRLRKGERIVFELSREGTIRTMVLSYLIYHRGQFSVYLHLKDVPPPTVYGPTADEQ